MELVTLSIRPLGWTCLLLLVARGTLSALQTDTVPADTVITLERTACFGACPVYRVTIDATGTVTYDGIQDVGVTGRQTTRIPVARVAALLDSAERLGFFSLDDHYRQVEAIDAPTRFVKITTRGRTKHVEDHFGAPAALREFEQQIDDAAKTIQWIHFSQDICSRGLKCCSAS